MIAIRNEAPIEVMVALRDIKVLPEMFQMKQESGLGRAIVVGYLRVVAASSVLTSAMKRLGIETMTPEEFVAEFGPKEFVPMPD